MKYRSGTQFISANTPETIWTVIAWNFECLPPSYVVIASKNGTNTGGIISCAFQEEALEHWLATGSMILQPLS